MSVKKGGGCKCVGCHMTFAAGCNAGGSHPEMEHNDGTIILLLCKLSDDAFIFEKYKQGINPLC